MATMTDRRMGLSSALHAKAPVRCATTAEITLSGFQTIDGVLPTTSEHEADRRVLVKNQSTTAHNGIYIMGTGPWQRARDFDGNGDFIEGTRVIVRDGTAGTGQVYGVSSNIDLNSFQIDTDAITFESVDFNLNFSLTPTLALHDDETDYVFAYDTSASAWSKVLGKNLGFTASGGGLRSLQSKLREVEVNVNDFSGTFTVALAAAIATGAQNIIIPAGSHTLTTGVDIAASGQRLIGKGRGVTIITSSATGPTINVPSGFTGIEFHDFSLTRASGGGTSGRNGIHFAGLVERAHISGVDVSNHYEGFRLCATSYSKVRDCFADNNFSNGFRITNSDGTAAGLQWDIEDCLAQRNDGFGFLYESAFGSSAALGPLKDPWTYANKLGGCSFQGAALTPINGVRIYGGFMGEDGKHSVYLDTYGTFDIHITDLLTEINGTAAVGVNQGTSATNEGSGIYLTANNTSAKLTGVTALGHSWTGIKSACPRVVITGATVRNNGAAALAGEQIGIDITAGQATITGNSSKGSTQLYGVSLTGDNHVVVGNDLSENATDGLTTGGIQTSTVLGNKGTTFAHVPRISQNFALTGVLSPSQITSNQNNYSPTSLDVASFLRLSTDAARELTGLAGGAAGRIITIHNIGSNTLTLRDENGSSTDTNRFALNGDVALQADECVTLQYDNTTGRWRIIGRYFYLGDDLTALEALSTTGLAVRTGSGTWTTRSLANASAGLTWTNGDGVSGNPTPVLANDLAALEALSSTGFAVRTTTDTWAQRVLGAPAAGLTITNNNGVSGNPAFTLANDLDALEGLSSTGFAVRTGTDAWAQRSLAQPAAGLTISNSDGVSGNPTFALANDLAALEALSGTSTIYYRSGSDTWSAVSISANLGFTTGTLGSALGTAATANTGTSGATVPLLNGTNTHSGINTFSNTTETSSTSTGGVILSGGLGIAKSAIVGVQMGVGAAFTASTLMRVGGTFNATGAGTIFAFFIDATLNPQDGSSAFFAQFAGTVAAGTGETHPYGIGLYINPLGKSGSGTVTSAYGLYVDAQTIGGTNNYSAYFGGNVTIGSETGAGRLSVAGGKIQGAAATTSYPTINIPSGTAPSSPTSGDMWYNGTNLMFRDGGTTRTITWA
jgi:hypothetical protein